MEARRKPTQERSRTRVNAILDATAQLISGKGISGLKIADIAEVAGVTPSSIYQYFPNKKNIIEALNERNIDVTSEMLEQSLKNISSLEEGLDTLENFADEYYLWRKKQSSITNAWYAISVDSNGQVTDIEYTQETANIIVTALSPYVDTSLRHKLQDIAVLFTHLVSETIRLCLTVGKEQSDQLFHTYKEIMHHSIRAMLVKS